MAAFSVGDSLFKNRDYAGAEPLLLNARNWDAKNWLQPATQRLALGAYGLKDYDKTVAYVKEYDAIPAPADPQAQMGARLPAALFYWLAESARKADLWKEAEWFYVRVTQHPDPGALLAGAWWELGEVQSHDRQWPAAVASYDKYRQLKPDTRDATVVLLALGRAQLGARNFDAARKLGDQALLQEPEGPHSAAARMLLGETAFATQNYPEAARMFATLAVLFDDPKITPQAISRAADAFEKAGQFVGGNFGGAEFAGRDIHIGDSGTGSVAGNCGKVVVLVRAKQMRIGSRAWRDDAGDFAADEFLAGNCRFHLIADRHAVTLGDQARNVAFRRMVGNAAHGDGLALFLIAGSESDFEFARGYDGVFEEHLVEIAETEEE